MTPSLREQVIYLCCIAAAVLVGYFAPQNFICALVATGIAYIAVFFHELGHTLFYWLYGYMAVPTFDFAHGGGMTYQFGERLWPLQIAVWGGLAYAVYLTRQRAKVLTMPVAVFAVLVFVTSLFALREDIIIFMGPGMEVIAAAFLLCRGYYNLWLSRPGERWINVFIGAYMLGSALTLVWALMFNPYFAADYEMQKGGHRLGDFNRLVDDLQVPMLTVGSVYIAYAIACIWALAAWIAHHLRADKAAA